MKERVILFSDAIFAIIITIMVLEMPVNFTADGTIDLPDLFRAIGIYFISFCFIAGIWFETAYLFARVEKVKNVVLVFYLLLLFCLSLVPMATRILIEDTNHQVLFLYGVLTLIITILARHLERIVLVSETKDKPLRQEQLKRTKSRSSIAIIFRLGLLVLGHYAIAPTLTIYLIMPILAFLQNIVDHQEEDYLQEMDASQQDFYLRDGQHLWGGNARKYKELLSASLKNREDLERGGDFRQAFNEEWQNSLTERITRIQTALKTADGDEKKRLEHELRHLEHELNTIQRRLDFPNRKDHWSKEDGRR